MAENSLTKILKSKFWRAAWAFFGRTYIMLGLALLGWGVDNLAGFFANPVRAGLALIVLANAAFLGWLIYHLPDQPGQEHDLEHWHYSLAEGIYILCAFGDRREVLVWAENPPLRWIGLGLYLLAAVYAAWTDLTWLNHLRQEAGRAADNPVFLTDGPYRWTRYPTLLALIVYSLGFVLAFRSWTGFIFLFPLIGTTLRRIHLRDQDYAARYPQAWVERSQTSKRILPFLF
jgi:protein-S-isoprenylcysteine O-methyltransferase Ste14